MVKERCKCKTISSKKDFCRDKHRNDGLHPQCKSCTNQFYDENRVKSKSSFSRKGEKIHEQQKDSIHEKRKQIKLYKKTKVSER